MQQLHVHLYDQAQTEGDNLIREVDLELIEVYDNYLQYGLNVGGPDAKLWVEIRVPRDFDAVVEVLEFERRTT